MNPNIHNGRPTLDFQLILSHRRVIPYISLICLTLKYPITISKTAQINMAIAIAIANLFKPPRAPPTFPPAIGITGIGAGITISIFISFRF